MSHITLKQRFRYTALLHVSYVLKYFTFLPNGFVIFKFMPVIVHHNVNQENENREHWLGFCHTIKLLKYIFSY